jgi:hypothetical protein
MNVEIKVVLSEACPPTARSTHAGQAGTVCLCGHVFQTDAPIRIARPAYIAGSLSKVNLPTRTIAAAATPTRNGK